MTRRRPNIVLINCDDLGYGDLGCYGSTANDTPVLDQLAVEGMRFTDFYMASPVCSASRGAMLTGCYPPRIGFGDFDGLPVLFPGHRIGLSPDEVTIASVLAGAGYATKIVGKWHCGDQPPFLPTRHGFDGYFGIPYSNDMGRQVWPEGTPPMPELMAQFGLSFPVAEMPPLPLILDEEVLEQQPDMASLTARFVDESVRFVRANRDRPFFLYLAHIYVHLPIYVQERFAAESRNGRYGAAVASIDWAAGVLMAELRRLGLDDDTVVIFTSDNGSRARDEGGSNHPLRGTKGTTWEGGLRVPCIVRWPGHVPAGVVSSALVTSMDLFPTLAALGGAEVPGDRSIDGVDVTDVFEGSPTSTRETFLYYWSNNLEAVRHGRWKLHLARDGQPLDALYDLVDDVGEDHDVFAAEPDVVAALNRLAEDARDELGDARLGRAGRGVRPIGEVAEPTPLTAFDPNHPYYVAEYDLPDRG